MSDTVCLVVAASVNAGLAMLWTSSSPLMAAVSLGVAVFSALFAVVTEIRELRR